jgi:hypothetical protein
VDIFHAHTGTDTWNIEMEGNEMTETVSVRITNEVRPLPLIGLGASLLRLTNGNGYLEQSVEAASLSQPSWVHLSGGGGPSDWVNQW